jgi:hypothetical protein
MGSGCKPGRASAAGAAFNRNLCQVAATGEMLMPKFVEVLPWAANNKDALLALAADQKRIWQYQPLIRHSRESGNPGLQGPSAVALDPRFRGGDV